MQCIKDHDHTLSFVVFQLSLVLHAPQFAGEVGVLVAVVVFLALVVLVLVAVVVVVLAVVVLLLKNHVFFVALTSAPVVVIVGCSYDHVHVNILYYDCSYSLQMRLLKNSALKKLKKASLELIIMKMSLTTTTMMMMMVCLP